jgi:hypothetical protein
MNKLYNISNINTKIYNNDGNAIEDNNVPI